MKKYILLTTLALLGTSIHVNGSSNTPGDPADTDLSALTPQAVSQTKINYSGQGAQKRSSRQKTAQSKTSSFNWEEYSSYGLSIATGFVGIGAGISLYERNFLATGLMALGYLSLNTLNAWLGNSIDKFSEIPLHALLYSPLNRTKAFAFGGALRGGLEFTHIRNYMSKSLFNKIFGS